MYKPTQASLIRCSSSATRFPQLDYVYGQQDGPYKNAKNTIRRGQNIHKDKPRGDIRTHTRWTHTLRQEPVLDAIDQRYIMQSVFHPNRWHVVAPPKCTFICLKTCYHSTTFPYVTYAKHFSYYNGCVVHTTIATPPLLRQEFENEAIRAYTLGAAMQHQLRCLAWHACSRLLLFYGSCWSSSPPPPSLHLLLYNGL